MTGHSVPVVAGGILRQSDLWFGQPVLRPFLVTGVQASLLPCQWVPWHA